MGKKIDDIKSFVSSGRACIHTQEPSPKSKADALAILQSIASTLYTTAQGTALVVGTGTAVMGGLLLGACHVFYTDSPEKANDLFLDMVTSAASYAVEHPYESFRNFINPPPLFSAEELERNDYLFGNPLAHLEFGRIEPFEPFEPFEDSEDSEDSEPFESFEPTAPARSMAQHLEESLSKVKKWADAASFDPDSPEARADRWKSSPRG